MGIRLILYLTLLISACSLQGGTLGGREKCWGQSDPRTATLMKGWIRLDSPGMSLETPEGDIFPLSLSGLTVDYSDETPFLVDADSIVARDDELVTLFGGVGADGSMVVCVVEERHGAS